MDVESGIHRHGIRNPQTWNPESTDMESGIHSVESEIQDSLGLPYVGRRLACKTCYYKGTPNFDTVYLKSIEPLSPVIVPQKEE